MVRLDERHVERLIVSLIPHAAGLGGEDLPDSPTAHGPSSGPRWPSLATHTPRHTTAVVKPKTKSVTPRLVTGGDRESRWTVQRKTAPPRRMTATGDANPICPHTARWLSA